MKTAIEITNALENIKYYSKRIDTLAREQLEADVQLGNINAQVGSVRFDALGAIGASCGWLETYADNIGHNLKVAVEQDRYLQAEEEQEEIF